MPNPTVPLTILTGFLGAGKTTLLNRILNADHGLRIAVLVNDFGSINIDSDLVAATSVDGDTVSLSNGCICCTIRGDLLQAVENLFTMGEPPEYIVIEASGVSDPMEIALTFRDVMRMRELVHIDSIITVMDAEQFRDVEREHAVLAMNQIGMADIVVLNKVDLVDEATLKALEATINHIMPNSRIFRTTYSQVPMALLLGVGSYDPERLAGKTASEIHVHEDGEKLDHDHHHTDHSTVFNTWNWVSSKPMSLKAVERAVKQLPPSIYRLKGVLYLHSEPETRVILQVVGKRANISHEEPWGDIPPATTLVAIGTEGGVNKAELDALFEGAQYENAPKNELERLARGVMSFLRG